MESFSQGYRLEEGDLNKTFYRNSVYYSGSTGNFYTPYWVRYEIGKVNASTGLYYAIGSTERIPDFIQTGVVRPNFIIGENWDTGIYELKWIFKDSANSAEEIAFEQFEVVTEGIYDSGDAVPFYVDLPGSFIII